MLNPTKAPLICAGQVYLQPELNEYLIVTRSDRGQVYYEGLGFKGQAEDQAFIERFGPVDPSDVEAGELQTLLQFCPANTKPQVGLVL